MYSKSWSNIKFYDKKNIYNRKNGFKTYAAFLLAPSVSGEN
jgi:hypothetical protein